MKFNKNNPDCWIVTEGMAGTENQCIGVAEALGVHPQIIKIKLRQPWKTLSPYLGFECACAFDPAPAPPWPDLLIAAGRKSIAAARYIRKVSGGKTFTVQIQDPRISPSAFDLVAVPEHDPTRGDNVIVTAAAPNRVTPERLAAAREAFPHFASLKRPRIAVLIGGDSKAHRLTPDVAANLAAQLKSLNAGLMITTSRRTGAENEALLRESLQDPGVWFWDGRGENPYFAMLGWADFIIVTNDSVSMLSDAASTGKPVYMVPLEGGAARLNALHRNLINRGILRVFEGKLEPWSYVPLRDSAAVAEEIRKRLQARG